MLAKFKITQNYANMDGTRPAGAAGDFKRHQRAWRRGRRAETEVPRAGKLVSLAGPSPVTHLSATREYS